MTPQEKSALAARVLVAVTTPLLDATGQRRLSDVKDIASMSDMTIPITASLSQRIETVAEKKPEDLIPEGFVVRRGESLHLNVSALFDAQPDVAVVKVPR